MTSITGLRGIDHVGITVPNVDEAIAFFVDVLGCEHFYDLGPWRDDEGTWFADNLNLHPRAHIPRAAMLRCGNGSNIELFEYVAPDQSRQMPLMSDWGSTHLAFYVDDMSAALDGLERHGVRILGGAKDGLGAESGPETSFAHFLSPWGMLLEFVSFPLGKQYMHERERLLWRPHHPNDEER